MAWRTIWITRETPIGPIGPIGLIHEWHLVNHMQLDHALPVNPESVPKQAAFRTKWKKRLGSTWINKIIICYLSRWWQVAQNVALKLDWFMQEAFNLYWPRLPRHQRSCHRRHQPGSRHFTNHLDRPRNFVEPGMLPVILDILDHFKDLISESYLYQIYHMGSDPAWSWPRSIVAYLVALGVMSNQKGMPEEASSILFHGRLPTGHQVPGAAGLQLQLPSQVPNPAVLGGKAMGRGFGTGWVSWFFWWP